VRLLPHQAASTSACAARLAWPLSRLARAASWLIDSGAKLPMAARQRASPTGRPNSPA
jgi:hypothetical protein